MIDIATLLLAAAALAVALAAFRRSNAANQAQSSARDQGIRQDLSDLKTAIEALPGRFADEVSGSPLREAVEGVRESVARAGQTLEGHVERVGQGFVASTKALEASIDRGFEVSAQKIDAVRVASEATSKVLAEIDPKGGFQSLEGAFRELLKAADEHADAREKSLEAGIRKVELSLLPVVDSLGRLMGRVDALPEGLEAQFARLEAATAGLSQGMTEIVGAVRALADVQGTSGDDDRVVDGIASLGQELSNVAKAAEAASLPVLESLGSLSRDLRASLAALPVQIAEASAAHARPMPELEELAIAVRESGHMRGDASRAVADAVSRVSQELSESAREGAAAREEAAASLTKAMESLEVFSRGIEDRLAPLSDALKGHGDAVAPMAQGLNLAQDRLEEAASSLRANQVEFAASVALFTQAAQELSGGLSLFAHEGEKQGAEDPRAAQKALLESLDRLMGGFAESLKALLTESDLRTREVLAEIAARLPAGEGA